MAVEQMEEIFARLRRKLLDLTGRNRLLNFRHSPGRSLQTVEGSPEAVYARLTAGGDNSKMMIRGVPEPPRSAWVERNGRLARPDVSQWASAQNIRTSYDLPPGAAGEATFRALLYPEDLARHCRKLQREATLAIEETGANMLFLVLGFLEYPDQADSDRKFLAPLISIPVSFSQSTTGGERNFSIEATGDDLTVNLSLQEKLRTDHSIELPEFDEDSGNVEAHFAAVAKAVAKRPGFEVRRRASLCLLSFTNMLLVRDLEPKNWLQADGSIGLFDHEVIQRLFEGGREEGTDFEPKEHDVEEGQADRIPLVFDADSSQHSALVDALQEGRNLVIEGPPGTGKSQTITNLIAACLESGKTVLFVAEKLAALEVVKSRLAMAGLDRLVLELHSTKTHKKAVLEDLGRRIEFRPNAPADLESKLTQRAEYRRRLKAYSNLLGSIRHNRLGLNLHTLMWKAERHRLGVTAAEFLRSPPEVADAVELTDLTFRERVDGLKHLSDQLVVIGFYGPEAPFWGFFPRALLPGDDQRIGQHLREALGWANDFLQKAEAYRALLGDGTVGLSATSGLSQIKLLQALSDSLPHGAPFAILPRVLAHDSRGTQALELAGKIGARIDEYHGLEPTVRAGLVRESLATPEDLEALQKIQMTADELGATLGTVADTFSFLERLRRAMEAFRAVREQIAEYCKRLGLAVPATRLGLRVLECYIEVAATLPEEHWQHFSPALQELGATYALAELQRKQDEWQAGHHQLNQRLYLDALPPGDELRVSIFTLREGEAWYRVFQRRWRAAVRVHRRLSRVKERATPEQRLADLERIQHLLTEHERWRADPAWERYGLGQPGVEPRSLAGHLAISSWYDGLRKASGELASTNNPPLPSPSPADASRCRREYREFQALLKAASSHLQLVDAFLPSAPAGDNVPLSATLEGGGRLCGLLEAAQPWLRSAAPPEGRFAGVTKGCAGALRRLQIINALDSAAVPRQLFGEHFRGLATDVSAICGALHWVGKVQNSDIPEAVKQRLCVVEPRRALDTISAALSQVLAGLSASVQLESTLRRYGECDLAQWTGVSAEQDIVEFARRLIRRLSLAAASLPILPEWARYLDRRRECLALGLEPFINSLERGPVEGPELADAYAYAALASIVRAVFRREQSLAQFAGLQHSQIQSEFRKLDREIVQGRGRAVARTCVGRARPPTGSSGMRVDEKTEMNLIEHLIPQQRPRVSVRKMLRRAGSAVQALKPCFMMGPHAVAQFLEPAGVKFDVVIMDEASQLRPEEAIGAVARGRQLIVVGDPKQLPPSSFFDRQSAAGEDAEELTVSDMESILDLAIASFRPIRTLRWHYRSKHHSLIEFSNHVFYKGRLIVCPSPYGHGASLGIRATYLSDAVYEDQTNLREAERVVDAVVEHVLTRKDDSLGVVTLNIKQRDLIAELFEERLSDVEGADAYLGLWRECGQPLFIKNLENVQGDERDCIIISTTFGKGPGSTTVRQNFGPISQQGGGRRLNVLFTRARKAIRIFTSLRPEDIVAETGGAEGPSALRQYLEYARSGILTKTELTGAPADSDFEVAVMDVLRRLGYEVVPQLGVSGFRIDIAVKHPDHPGAYLAAIECDGARYHSSQSARDRDRIRQDILESQGWAGRIWRIWSTDWFRSPQNEIHKLQSFLDDLRRTWRPEHWAGESWVEEARPATMATAPNAAELRSQVQLLLVADESELEVRRGDTVRYAPVERPDDIKTVRITQRMTVPEQGLIAESTPLAEVLLGAVEGDEVTLNVPVHGKQVLRVIEIRRQLPGEVPPESPGEPWISTNR
jgi:very-short-patch-repair endonuclease